MNSHHLRGIILKLQDRLSDNDRRRLHFFLGNDVPRRIRDDPSHSGTLGLIESLFDQDKINEQDFTLLINAFYEIQCIDAVKVLKEHMRQMQINGQKQSSQDLLSILVEDQEEDKYNISSPLINQKNTYGNYNTITGSVNTATNPVTVVIGQQSSELRRKCLFELPTMVTNFILFSLLISIIGLSVSTGTFILKFSVSKSVLEEKERIISTEQENNINLTGIIKQLNNELNDYKRDEEQITVRRGRRNGGFGGTPFDDAKDQQLPSMAYCTGVEVVWGSQLVAIRFIYGQDNSSTSKIYHGSDKFSKDNDTSLSSDTFLLSNDEKISKVILYAGEGNGTHEFKIINTPISHIMGIQFFTTIGHSSSLYGTNDGQEFTESYEGFTLGYATGASGELIDMLQFVWYKQVMVHNGSCHGGIGGVSFDDSKELQLSPMAPCIGIQGFWRSKLVALKFIYEQDKSSILNISHGSYGNPSAATPALYNHTFWLSENERINKVTVYVGNGTGVDVGLPENKTIRFVMGIQFNTTDGQLSPLYGATNEEVYTESFEGFVLGYATGSSGGLIDMLQFVWYKNDPSDKVHDVFWVENKYGEIPSNAAVGGYEGHQRVYVVRVDFGSCLVPGKLIETSKTAEIPLSSNALSSPIYQVLYNPDSKSNFKWEIMDSSIIPKYALRAGNDRNSTLYVGRFNTSDSNFIGQYNETSRKFYYAHEGTIHEVKKGFELLCVV